MNRSWVTRAGSYKKTVIRRLEPAGNQGLHPELQHQQVLRRNAFVGHRSRKNPADRDRSNPDRSCWHPSNAAFPGPYPWRRMKPAEAALLSRSIWPELAVSHSNNTSFQFLSVLRALFRTHTPDRLPNMELSSKKRSGHICLCRRQVPDPAPGSGLNPIAKPINTVKFHLKD